MRTSGVTQVGGLLAATAVLGVLAVLATPDGSAAIGLWPVGLATGCVLITERPRTPYLILLIGLIGALSIWLGGYEPDIAVGLGCGLALQVWISWWILTGGRRVCPPMQNDAELARFLIACLAGAVAMAAVTLLTSVVTDWGSPLLLMVSVGASSTAAQLTLVPFFMRLRAHAALATQPERAIQWLLILTLTPVVFLPTDFPAIVFMVIPLLGWGALRASAYEALGQLLVVLLIGVTLTAAGHGPFAQIEATWDLPVDVQGAILAAFVIDCALVVIPLMLTVGEQIENARQTAAERDKVQSIVDGTTGVAIIGTDDFGHVTLFNPGAVRLLGYQPEEILGRTTRILHSDAAVAEKSAELGVDNDFSLLAQSLMGRGPTEMKFLRKDGVERSHWMSLNRVVDDRGVVIGYVSTSEDITERLEAESRLVESLEAERQAVERLREVDQVKDAFVSSVSHELRTPITSILGYTEMLEDGLYGELGEDQLDAVRRVSANSSRLLSLIDDLLVLSRLQEGGLGLLDRVVDLRKIVTAGCAVITPTLERRSLDLTVALPDEPVPFLGDRDMLERVVINLVGNAVKFSADGDRVCVELSTDTDWLVLQVADTGIGIPKHEQERLFSRFFRSSLAQQRAIPGSGLGLSIAHAIVEQHGGKIDVESEPGEGTTFRVKLPVLAPA